MEGIFVFIKFPVRLGPQRASKQETFWRGRFLDSASLRSK